jgi:uncharacterized protein
MARPLLVEVGDLLRRPGTRKPVWRQAEVPGLELSASRVPEGEPVVVDVVLESLSDGVMAYGTVEAPWSGTCRRCLKPASGVARARLRELFERRPTEGESYPLRGEQVDLADMVRDAALLELPIAPLCSEACQGLCPQCGADRNQGECGCEPEQGDPRWAALDELRFETERPRD